MTSLNNVIRELHMPLNNTLVLAVAWIITRVYDTSGSGPTLISQYADSKSAYREHNDIIEAILIQISRNSTTRVLLEENKSFDNENKALNNLYHYLNNEEYFYRLNGNRDKAIWFIDSLDSFKLLVDDLLNERNNYYRNGFFCIIYTGREADRLKTLQTIFRRLFRIYVINVNVLITVGQTVYVYTYFPFSKTKCHNVEPEFHGVFGLITNYKFSRKRFFPKKLSNMWRCRIKVTTWTALPFVEVEYNKTTGDLISLKGIEGRLMVLLAERMNFSIQIVEEPNKTIGNGTEPGAIKMLKDGVTNITIVRLIYDKARLKVAQPAYTYLQIPFNLAIPLGEMMTPLERLIRPFQYIVWTCLSSSVLIGIFIVYLIRYLLSKRVQEFVFGAGNRIPFTNIFNVFYGGPIAGRLPRRNFARYLLVVWIFYTFIIRSAYLAQLFLILQDSRAHSKLNTVNEALQKDFTFYAAPLTVPTLIGASSKQIKVELISSGKNSSSDLLKLLSKSKHLKIAVTEFGHVIHVFNQNLQNHMNRVNILPEPIFNAPVTFYMRKHSYLANEINELLLNIMSAGLISKFEDLSLSQRAYAAREEKSQDAIPLSLLIGIFFVHLVLLLLCTLVFLLEIWSKYSPLTRRVINFFNI